MVVLSAASGGITALLLLGHFSEQAVDLEVELGDVVHGTRPMCDPNDLDPGLVGRSAARFAANQWTWAH